MCVATETEPGAPSYVNALRSVPKIRFESVETVTAFSAPVPAGCPHVIEVVVTHSLKRHAVVPIDANGAGC